MKAVSLLLIYAFLLQVISFFVALTLEKAMRNLYCAWKFKISFSANVVLWFIVESLSSSCPRVLIISTSSSLWPQAWGGGRGGGGGGPGWLSVSRGWREKDDNIPGKKDMLHMICGNHIIGGIGGKIGEYGLTFCCCCFFLSFFVMKMWEAVVGQRNRLLF